MVQLTCFGGINEIGGNKFLLENDGTRVFLDFGMSFGQKNAYFDEFLQPRTNSCLRDLLQLGMLPAVDGIYRDDLIDIAEDVIADYDCPEYWTCDIQSYQDYKKKEGKPYLDAVLLSHAHADHYQYISYLDPEIPIYCSPITKVMLQAISDVSRSGIENEFYQIKKRIIAHTSERSTFPDEPRIKTEEPRPRDIRPIESKEPISIGTLQVRMLPVDHSVPGASAFYIVTSDGTRLLYTGDIRFHGRFMERTKAFKLFIQDAPVDILLCEGTRIDKEARDDELGVEEDMQKMIEQKDGLAIVDFGWKDTTRFETLKNVAELTGRTLVVNPKLAYLLWHLSKELPHQFSSIEAYENMGCYLKRTRSMLYAKSDYSHDMYHLGYHAEWGCNELKKARTQGDHDLINQALRHYYNGIRAYDIKQNPGDYIVMASFYDMNELFDLGPPDDSTYIRAHCEPFNDEMAIDEQKLKNWLSQFGLLDDADSQLNHFHASGHASGIEIKEMIHDIHPDIVIPIHTEHPEAFKDVDSDVVIAQQGEPIKL